MRLDRGLNRLGLALGVAGIVVFGGVIARGRDAGKPAFRDGFETGRTAWRQEETDATVNLLEHDRTELARHEGRQAERFHFEAGPGSALYYSYHLPKVPLVDDLEANLFVRSDHAGLQLFAHVVLPSDTDPETRQASFVLVPGPSYEGADRWQRLRLADIRAEVERRARVLRLRTKRPISLEGAYVDQLVVNLYGGPGETMVYIDELAISPVPAEVAASAPSVTGAADANAAEEKAPGTSRLGATGPGPGGERPASDRIKMVRNRLFKDGKHWIFTGVHAPGANVETLRRHGFDLFAADLPREAKEAEEAARSGFLLMAGLDGAAGERGQRDPSAFAAAASSFSGKESVAFWNLGSQLGASIDPAKRTAERDEIRAAISAIHSSPSISPLTTATVDGIFPEYARPPQNLDLMGVEVAGWGTALEPKETLRYLIQRRDLTALRNPQGLFWAAIPAAVPEVVHRAVWGDDLPPAKDLARMQPEQLRLYTYAALSAGYRGLCYQCDGDITRFPGKAMLIELALLNAEVDLFETVIGEGFDPIPLLATYPPDPPIVIVYQSPGSGGQNSGGLAITSIKSAAKKRPEVGPHGTISAAAISSLDKRTKLLLVADYAAGAQYQPSQMAINNLKIRIPGVAESAQAYEISLGEVQALEERERVPGGVQVSLPEFGSTALVLITTDTALVERVKAAVASVRSLAIAMAIEKAKLQLQWVREVHERLEIDGHNPKNAEDLLADAENRIVKAEDALAREDYSGAWREAHRSGRPLRLVMRSHFDDAHGAISKASAHKDEPPGPPPPRPSDIAAGRIPKRPKPKYPPQIVTHVSSPALLAFNTLPQAYVWSDWIDGAKFGRSLLRGGSFEDPDPAALAGDGWENVSYPVEDVSSSLSYEKGGWNDNGRQVLKLSVTPREKGTIDALTPFLDHPVAALRSPPIPVRARQLLRITMKIKMPRAHAGGRGGLIVRDSLGGEQLQFRTTSPLPDWHELVLYRRAADDGNMTLTLGLAGYGDAYFDDVKIEPLLETGTERKERGDDLAEDGSNGASRTRRRAPRAPEPNPRASSPSSASRPSRTTRAVR